MSEIKQGYKQTKVGIIPEDWDVVKLESISDFITKGATPTTYGFNWQENGIPFLRSECVSDNGLNLKSAMYICQDAHNVMKRSAITSGDILMTITGNVGRVILLENFQEGNINQHIARIRIIKEIANRNFIFSFLSQSTYQINYSKITTGQAYPQLSLVQVRDSFVAFPPLKEQEKIAEILTTWDEAITKQTELLEAKELQKKALMQKLLSGEVRFSGFSDEWEEVRLGEICEYKNGGAFEEHVIENGKYLLITLNSIDINGKLKTEHKTVNINDNSLKKDDLIMVLSDVAHGDFLGLTDVILENDRYVLNQRMGALKPKKLLNSFFLSKLINSNQRYFKRHGQGSSQQNLSKGDITKFKIKLPSLPEQQKIAEVLSLAEEEINLLKKELDELKQQKKALMQKLLTGEVRVKV
jgi:type I restriction enzyme S subunit